MRTTAWLAATALGACLSCSKVPEGPRQASPPKIDHILLEVTDLKASTRFYRDLIGLQVKSTEREFVTLEAANVGVFLWSKRWEWEAPRARGERQGLGMYPHVVVGDVRGVVERVRLAGYKVVQEPKWHLYGTEAFVADPDGYVWALMSR